MKVLQFGAGLFLLGAATFSNPAAAMPIIDLHAQTPAAVDQVRWVCGPYRCWWRPNYWAPGPYAFYAGPRFYARPWGWRRWHRWHYW